MYVYIFHSRKICGLKTNGEVVLCRRLLAQLDSSQSPVTGGGRGGGARGGEGSQTG